MLRNILLGLLSTHLEINDVLVGFESGQISALLQANDISSIWYEVTMTIIEDVQICNYKIDTNWTMIWQIARFKTMVEKINHNRNRQYYDIKYMIPVRSSERYEAMA